MNLPAARFLSFILNPLMVIVLVPFFLVYRTTGDLFAAFNWTIYTLLFLLIIGVFILLGVRKGIFTDYDVSKREQRPLLFLISIVLTVLYLIGLYFFNAPRILLIVTSVLLVGIVSASIINHWIKASMHVATVTAIIVGLVAVYGGYFYLLLLLIPVVAYIRVRAKRHTVPETIVGGLFGSALSLLMYIMVTSFLD